MKNRCMWISIPNERFNSRGEFIGNSSLKMMSDAELDDFISKQLFPMGIVPGGVINYLKVKHLRKVKYIRDYVLTHVPSSKERPARISQLKDSIDMALIEDNIDIDELRYFDEEEVREWKIAKENGELGPFGNIKRK